MSRVDDDILSLHLEMALATTPPALLDGLTDSDRHRRHAAVGQIARQLVDRLRCFEIRSDEDAGPVDAQACLFPNDLGPIGRAYFTNLTDLTDLQFIAMLGRQET